MTKSLIKNTGIYIICGFFAQGFIFLLWLILARFLVPEQIGIYALVMFVIEFFSALSIFGLDAAITRFYYSKEDNSFVLNNALTIFLCTGTLSLLLFFFTAKIMPLFIPGLSNILEENLFLFGAIILANSLFGIVLVHYVALKEAASYTKLQIFKTLSFCLLSLVFIYFGFGILGLFYALLFSSLSVIILFIIKKRKTISFRIISRRFMRDIASYSFPLMLYSSFGIASGYFGRLLLDRYTDLAILGVYSLFLMLTLQVNGLWSSFNRAWTPEIFSKLLKNREKVMENIRFTVFFSSFFYLLAFGLFIILGELFLFRLIFKEIYFANVYIFYILLLAPLFTGIYTAVYPLCYYKKKTKIIFYLSLIISLASIFLTFFMVRFFNQTGAALSYFFTIVFTTIIYLIAFKKIMKIPWEIINWTLFLLVLVIFSIAVLLKTSSHILFLAFVILEAFLAYRIGNLSKKKHLFFNFLKELKMGQIFLKNH